MQLAGQWRSGAESAAARRTITKSLHTQRLEPLEERLKSTKQDAQEHCVRREKACINLKHYGESMRWNQVEPEFHWQCETWPFSRSSFIDGKTEVPFRVPIGSSG
jgi:hypothetical protein